ncbi:pyruvate dehydrogenase (acetyl-transferring), homodimeric type [Luteibacter anthropi]|uniref:Pyruvate dehydrogenase E1 component n=1 Tax=Luteibacter anthropi TaxID=564369 RepID=A0A7X5UD14_9GAMM|nr:pyruvate dehydrogenase (acetyl-transferring), homodimeric type [Luteibacter anthropi]NII08142.1 pyruvate dehydrogenase (acetyl-transferring), homodimeric type [Luteibacter anthropi]URX64196.1 pyruvate dehydrogenase (acetyl-transferring), homodimeric type [Luteibacter anthropi]
MDQIDDILNQDLDPTETREWVESLNAVINHDGTERAHYLLERMVDSTRRAGGYLPFAPTTEYVNTIPPHMEARSPGDAAIEWRIRSLIRWNALATVVRANRKPGDLGGHISSFASSATLYDVGFNHFWRAPSAEHPGDLVFHQGHSAPGVYARSFLEGRIGEDQLDLFRMEVEGKGRGLSSYPHPWLMPDYWQVPTVSMGLGPIQAIYQAQFWKYLEHRGLMPKTDRKIWCFMGDGESDEPESLGAISLAGREGLDNLIFVINCNLQRLDGPVRGNGKIIQELEGVFRGAGWNAIKVAWGSYWDPLLARDTTGKLRQLMMETVDGEYQACKAFGGAYTREKFFGKYPETAALVANMSDDDIWRLNRGGHDPHKVYAAYHAAVNTKGMPTVILAKTVKGYGMGAAGESQNPAHNQKKMDTDAIRAFRDRFNIPVPDDKLDEVPYYHPGKDSEEVQYMLERRRALGGSLPQRRRKSDTSFQAPSLEAFEQITKGTGDREISTTMALVRGMNLMLRDKELGPRIVPIVADEARTFGMEGMFRQIGIYAPFGQKYRPQDADQLLYYREDQKGQVLQEGISEAGGMSAWLAAATSYSISNTPMLPFFIYYSMFGFQRIGDLCWAAGDMRARGFLIGGTSGRTTLNGEGLQHEDGHSHLLSGAIPNVVSYDPTFSYELAVILQDGTRRMMQEQEDVYYYITVMNENYAHPDLPKGSEEGIVKGMYLFKDAGKPKKNEPRVQLMGAGTILREVIAAAELLEKDFGVSADIWSVPSFSEVRREGFDAERWNRLHPESPQRVPYITGLLADRQGPAIAATDYVRELADQVRAFMPDGMRYTVLGTDGYGRSDTRANLRSHFEVDRYWIAHAALAALAKDGKVNAKDVSRAIKEYKLDMDKPNPMTV